MATDSLPLQDSLSLGEDLGVEYDTDEHLVIERGPLGAVKNLKRKR
jgi:26S proteasome regulatory subunit (ATPase 3-interacting protein)